MSGVFFLHVPIYRFVFDTSSIASGKSRKTAKPCQIDFFRPDSARLPDNNPVHKTYCHHIATSDKKGRPSYMVPGNLDDTKNGAARQPA